MIHTVLIDDEPNNIETLTHLIEKHCPDISIVGSALDVAQGYDLICSVNPDLVFLDIQMPVENGFDLLTRFDHYDFEIIFVTAFDQYAIQAIKFSAIDYLLKPLQPAELTTSVSRVREKIKLKKDNLLLTNFLEHIRNKDNKHIHKLALTTTKETLFVSPDKIIRCEASNAYTTFHFNDGKKLTVSKPIYEYEELLAGYGFIRCHQSHLINKNHVKSLRKEDGGYLLMEDDSRIPISRGKKELVLKNLISTHK
ncbi:MAG TPA: LytTR family DNA-binding domain-containing protein [Sediminibacterium sp.]